MDFEKELGTGTETHIVEKVTTGNIVTAEFNHEYRVETDIQVNTAHLYPRQLSQVHKNILFLATKDKEVAESCFYAVRRDGKTIRGASIRFAEIITACYGNIRASSRIISNDGKFVTAQGMCWDLQNNIAFSVEVKRRITTKTGMMFSDDMIVITSNACSSIALRNAIFKVVPEAVTLPIQKEIKRVVVGEAKDFETTRKTAIEYFVELGVAEKDILNLFGKKMIEDLDQDDIFDLRGIATAIIDGDTTLDLAFQVTPKNTAIGKSSRILATPLNEGDGDYEKTIDFRRNNNNNNNNFTEYTIEGNENDSTNNTALDKKAENLKKLESLGDNAIDLNDAVGKTVNSTEINKNKSEDNLSTSDNNNNNDNISVENTKSILNNTAINDNNNSIENTESIIKDNTHIDNENIAIDGIEKTDIDNTNEYVKNILDYTINNNNNFLNESEQKSIIDAAKSIPNLNVVIDNDAENTPATKIFDSAIFNETPLDKPENPINTDSNNEVRTKRPYNKKKKDGDVGLFTDNKENTSTNNDNN